MLKHLSLLSALALSAPLLVPSAAALSAAEIKQCRALGASLQVRQGELTEMTEAREALVEQVQTAGDAWESAEALRNFGKAKAAEADSTKATYDALKKDLMRKEMALQSAAGMLNGDVADYNAMCVKK